MRTLLCFAMLACGAPPASAPTQVEASAPIVDASAPEREAAPPPRDCTRAGQARTAPVGLFDAFMKDPKDVGSFLDEVKKQGGTPLEDPSSERVVFLARGAGPWSVAGSFSAWKSVPMKNVAGDLWALDASVAGPHEYKLIAGSFREDPLAVNVAWDGIDRKGVGEVNAIVHQRDASLAKGRLARGSITPSKPELGGARDVFTYFPPAYDDGSCAERPVMIVHDGNESITRGDFVGAADAHFQAFPEDQAVLVFVALADQSARIDTYTFGGASAKGAHYVDLLASELLPKVRGLHVCQKRAGVAGASLGGLISSFAAFERPDVFGFVGSQSGSYWWDGESLVARAKSAPKIDARFYLDHGCPNDNCASNRSFESALTSKGYEVTHVEEPGAQHDWAFWRQRFPKLLRAFHARCD